MERKSKSRVILKICFLTILFCVTLLLSPNKGYAKESKHSVKINGVIWNYVLDPEVSEDGALKVYAEGLNDNLKTLVIPSELQGHVVESVGSNSYANNIIGKRNSQYNTSITKVVLPNTVKVLDGYTFAGLKGLTNIEGTENIEEIGNYVFQYCDSFTEFSIPESVKKINNYTFANCKNIEKLTFNSSLSVGSRIFKDCTSIKTIDFNHQDVEIGNSTFSEKNTITTILNAENISKIGARAFYKCTGLTGDLVLGDNLTTIGTSAFEGCTGIDGEIKVLGDKVISIGNSAFKGCENTKKVILSGNIKSVGTSAFEGFKDIFVNANEADSKTTFATNYSGYNNAYIHYLDDVHNFTVDVLPGIKAIDMNTGNEFVSGDFSDETDIKVKFELEDVSGYENLVLVIEKQGDYTNADNSVTKVNLEDGYTYIDSNLLRNTKLTTMDLRSGLDLSARMFLYQKNGSSLLVNRTPVYALEDGQIKYKHTKSPIIVETGDTLVYKIRVYNEGTERATANEITVHLPEGLEIKKYNSSINGNRWSNSLYWNVSEDGRTITTDQIKNRTIYPYNGTSSPSYQEIQLECVVTAERQRDILRLTNIVEITGCSGFDTDSTPGNMQVENLAEYKKEEAENSDSSSYIASEEDDQDFENVIILREVPVSYTLKLSKVDVKDFLLLNGAKFDLLNEDGEVLQSKVTVENGQLVFDTITTYDVGTDVYYIKESETPEGYERTFTQTIKLTIQKTIIDREAETYSLEISCDILETTVEVQIDEDTLVEIYTKEDLKKIGSGETFEKNGLTLKYGTENSYRLMNDIDLSGEEWTPLPNISGVFDGNGKTIKGLTITDKNKEEAGLFAEFSGIIENLTFKDVNIHIDLTEELRGLSLTAKEELVSKYRTGTVVGTMTGGSILNVEVNGAVTSSANNVGGFVGYCDSGYLTRLIDCTNNAFVVGYSNVGGIVGWTYSALTLTKCTNTAEIIATQYNAGGLVGYSEAKDYESSTIRAEYDSENSIIGLVVGNKVTGPGEYSLKLKNIDKETREILNGGVFTVYNENKVVICDNAKIENDELILGKYDILSSGIDTYYIKQNKAVDGYILITNYLKADLVKSWDGVNSKYVVSGDVKNITPEEFIEGESDPDSPIASYTGKQYIYNPDDTVKWQVNKVVAVDCTNKGSITGSNNAAGLFAKTYCNVLIQNSTNEGAIQGGNHIAGFLGEAEEQSKFAAVIIEDSVNKGAINGGENPGGIVSYTKVKTIVSGTNNEGTIDKGQFVAGIVCVAEADVTIDNCENKAKIEPTVNTNVSAGLLAQVIKSDAIIIIKNSRNYVDIKSGSRASGLAGYIYADEIRILNSEVKNCNITALSDMASGFVAYSATDTIVENSTVENVVFSNNGPNSGAMVALITDLQPIALVKFNNCTVKNVDLKTSDYAASKGAMAGAIIASNIEAIFTDCSIDKVNISFDRGGSYGGMLAGILQTYNYLEIDNCNVTNSGINSNTSLAAVGNLFGFSAMGAAESRGTITNCDITNNSISLNAVDYASNLIGFCDTSSTGSTFEMKDINIINSPITTTAQKQHSVGNIFGKQAGLSSNFSLENCKIEDSSVSTNAVYNSEVAVAIGGNYVSKYNFKNIDIVNSNVTTNGAFSGILMGFLDSDSSQSIDNIIEACTITDCHINKDLEDRTQNGCTANGLLIGLSSDTMTVKDVELNNGSIQGQNVGIIAGIALADTFVDNVIVNNYRLRGNTRGSIGGLVGVENTGLNISNSEISNLEIVNNFHSGGVLGFAGGKLDIDNTNISNITINNYEDGISGGVAGCVQSPIMRNSNVNHIRIETTTSTGNNMNFGGVIGFSNGSDYSEISDSSIKDIEIVHKPNYLPSDPKIGGVIGGADRGLVFENNIVDKVTIKAETGSIGGVVGQASVNTKDSKNTIKNVTINLETENISKSVLVGGFGGNISVNSNDTLQNLSLDNINITTNAMMARAGGIVGLISGEFKDSTITNSNVTATYKTDTVSPAQIFVHAGGAVGIVPYSSANHSGIKVQNTNVTIGSGYAGGAYGSISNNIKSIEVIGSNVKATSEISNVGGLVAVDNNHDRIEDSTVLGTTVSAVSRDATARQPGVSPIYPTGGIVGFTGGVVKGCNFVNSTVEATGANAYATGGIVGHGDNYYSGTSDTIYTVIEDCKVTDSKVIGHDGVGGIAGVAVVDIKGCTVEGTETIATGSSVPVSASMIGTAKTATEAPEVVEKVVENEPNEKSEVKEVESNYIQQNEGLQNNELESKEQVTEENIENTEYVEEIERVEEISEEGTIKAENDVENTDYEVEAEILTIEEEIVENNEIEENETTIENSEDALTEADEDKTEEIIDLEKTETNDVTTEVEEISEIAENETTEFEEVILEDNTSPEVEQNEDEIIIDNELVETTIKNDDLLNSIISPAESIVPNSFVVDMLALESETKTTVSGTNYVGGILGYSGVVVPGWPGIKMENCTVKNVTLEGKTDVNEDIGKAYDYPDTVSDEYKSVVSTIINFVKENVIVKIIE